MNKKIEQIKELLCEFCNEGITMNYDSLINTIYNIDGYAKVEYRRPYEFCISEDVIGGFKDVNLICIYPKYGAYNYDDGFSAIFIVDKSGLMKILAVSEYGLSITLVALVDDYEKYTVEGVRQ